MRNRFVVNPRTFNFTRENEITERHKDAHQAKNNNDDGDWFCCSSDEDEDHFNFGPFSFFLRDNVERLPPAYFQQPQIFLEMKYEYKMLKFIFPPIPLLEFNVLKKLSKLVLHHTLSATHKRTVMRLEKLVDKADMNYSPEY